MEFCNSYYCSPHSSMIWIYTTHGFSLVRLLWLCIHWYSMYLSWSQFNSRIVIVGMTKRDQWCVTLSGVCRDTLEGLNNGGKCWKSCTKERSNVFSHFRVSTNRRRYIHPNKTQIMIIVPGNQNKLSITLQTVD